jgi:hypothetical protein
VVRQNIMATIEQRRLLTSWWPGRRERQKERERRKSQGPSVPFNELLLLMRTHLIKVAPPPSSAIGW